MIAIACKGALLSRAVPTESLSLADCVSKKGSRGSILRWSFDGIHSKPTIPIISSVKCSTSSFEVSMCMYYKVKYMTESPETNRVGTSAPASVVS